MRRLALSLGMAVLATILSTGQAPGDPASNKAQPSPGTRLGSPVARPSGPMNARGSQPVGAMVVPGAGYGASYLLPYYGASPYFVPPPLYVPADTLYGPEAGSGPPGVIVAPQGKLQNDAGLDDKLPARGSGHDSLALAAKFIGFGDAHFHTQRYGDAYQRYRTAIETAPGLAEACFHQAFALVALGRYEQAAKMLKRGLALDPGWPKSGFKVADLYGRNALAKNAHVDAMARAANLDPSDADLLFLLGVWLHFDGQPDRAAPFFKRAAQLADGPHIRAFQEK
jgi:hypothetical protein